MLIRRVDCVVNYVAALNASLKKLTSTSLTKSQCNWLMTVLMGLIVAGGMLIPGNIPNIISAGKLNITSKEWAKIGLPMGFVLLIIYFIILILMGL